MAEIIVLFCKCHVAVLQKRESIILIMLVPVKRVKLQFYIIIIATTSSSYLLNYLITMWFHRCYFICAFPLRGQPWGIKAWMTETKAWGKGRGTRWSEGVSESKTLVIIDHYSTTDHQDWKTLNAYKYLDKLIIYLNL